MGAFRYRSKRTEPFPGGPKARVTIAWGIAPGPSGPTIRGPKARAKRLIPHKPLVELHSIFRKHHAHLCLKITPLVMRTLRIYVPNQSKSVAQANGERRIASLPAELRKLRALYLDPLGRRHLQSLDHSRYRFRSRKEERDVDVIGNTANTNADIFRSIENRGQVGMHLGPDCITQKWTSVLGTKDQMHKNVRKGLGHGEKYNASLQPANATWTLTWGFAPGYDISGLQPGTRDAIAVLAYDVPAPQGRTLLRLNENNTPIPSIQNVELSPSGLKARAKCLVSNPCIAAAVLLLICGIPSYAQPAPPLHIKIINAQTNKPIHDEKLNVALRVDQIGSVAMATDKNGIIAIDYGKATIIRILSNMYADCRPRLELYTNYSIDTIVKTGITTGNLCSSASPKAKPGELILYEIPKTFIPSYPAPPLPPPPHSDENPHAPPNEPRLVSTPYTLHPTP